MKTAKLFAFAFSLILALQADRPASAGTGPYVIIYDMRMATLNIDGSVSMTFNAEFAVDPAHASYNTLGVIIVAGPQGVLSTAPNGVTNAFGYFAGQNPVPDFNGNTLYTASPAARTLTLPLGQEAYYYAYFFLTDVHGNALAPSVIKYTFTYNQISPPLGSAEVPSWANTNTKTSTLQGFPFFIDRLGNTTTIDPANPPAALPASTYVAGTSYAGLAGAFVNENEGVVLSVIYNPVTSGNFFYGKLGYIVYFQETVESVQTGQIITIMNEVASGYATGVPTTSSSNPGTGSPTPVATNQQYAVIELPASTFGPGPYSVFFYLVDANLNAVGNTSIGGAGFQFP